jgi:hypothetical protein
MIPSPVLAYEQQMLHRSVEPTINHSMIPTINLGTDIESAFSADEFVTIEQLIEVTKTIAISIMRWSGARVSAGT